MELGLDFSAIIGLQAMAAAWDEQQRHPDIQAMERVEKSTLVSKPRFGPPSQRAFDGLTGWCSRAAWVCFLPARFRFDDDRSEHHDVSMRTTLTLEPDVARLLEEEAHRQRKSFKQVVNDALRRGLAPRVRGQAAAPRYEVQPHRTTLCPGIDFGSFNALADELEDEAVLEKVRSRR